MDQPALQVHEMSTEGHMGLACCTHGGYGPRQDLGGQRPSLRGQDVGTAASAYGSGREHRVAEWVPLATPELVQPPASSESGA